MTVEIIYDGIDINKVLHEYDYQVIGQGTHYVLLSNHIDNYLAHYPSESEGMRFLDIENGTTYSDLIIKHKLLASDINALFSGELNFSKSDKLHFPELEKSKLSTALFEWMRIRKHNETSFTALSEYLAFTLDHLSEASQQLLFFNSQHHLIFPLFKGTHFNFIGLNIITGKQTLYFQSPNNYHFIQEENQQEISIHSSLMSLLQDESDHSKLMINPKADIDFIESLFEDFTSYSLSVTKQNSLFFALKLLLADINRHNPDFTFSATTRDLNIHVSLQHNLTKIKRLDLITHLTGFMEAYIREEMKTHETILDQSFIQDHFVVNHEERPNDKDIHFTFLLSKLHVLQFAKMLHLNFQSTLNIS